MTMRFDLRGVDGNEIARLMEMLAESDVEECEIEQGGQTISLRRIVREGVASEEPLGPPPPDQPVREELATVRAPAVGVFSRSDKPSGPPRVEVGSRIKAGDVLGYIQVMTIPHGVVSTHDGIVEGFLVEDGQPVEYGQPLASIRPPAFSSQRSDD